MNRLNRLGARPRLESLETRQLLSTLSPTQVNSAYGLNAVSFANGAIKGDGRGQTIALIETYHDPSIYADLVAFDAQNNLANPILAWNLPSKLNTDGSRPTMTMVNFAGEATNPTWGDEEALDVEMAHLVAPAANLVIVEAKPGTVYDLITAIKAVETLPSVSVISMSWGGAEFQGQLKLDSTFTTPKGHTGITFIASSGDSGPGAQWPASSPNVVGVGGTSLVGTPSGGRASESAWSGSGGGISQYETRPTYQSKTVTGTMRSTPDVSIDADPGSGLMIVSRGRRFQVGGTSMGAPAWAGLVAIADQGLAQAGKGTLDGPSQLLPALYSAPSKDYYDVTTGPRAAVGYDTSTGLGTPNAVALVPYLDGNTTPIFGHNLASATALIPVPSVVVPLETAALDALLDSWDHSGPTAKSRLNSVVGLDRSGR